MNEEEWRPVVGYEGLYEVAKSGAVRNVQTGKVLAARNTHHGYKSVSLQTTGVGGKNHLVHRLVLAAWIGPAPSPQHQAAHLNGERTDNRLENLIWATARENNDHKKRHGTHRCGEAIANAKLNAKTVEEIRRMRAGGAQLREIAKAFGISRVTAGAVAGSRRWKHVAHCSMCIALRAERDALAAKLAEAEAKPLHPIDGGTICADDYWAERALRERAEHESKVHADNCTTALEAAHAAEARAARLAAVLSRALSAMEAEKDRRTPATEADHERYGQAMDAARAALAADTAEKEKSE